MGKHIHLSPLCVCVTCYAATFIFTLFSVVSQASTPMCCTSNCPNMHQYKHREHHEETIKSNVAKRGVFSQE
jgi:hypothetical protein